MCIFIQNMRLDMSSFTKKEKEEEKRSFCLNVFPMIRTVYLL